jgi:hypothetical protein
MHRGLNRLTSKFPKNLVAESNGPGYPAQCRMIRCPDLPVLRQMTQQQGKLRETIRKAETNIST